MALGTYIVLPVSIIGGGGGHSPGGNAGGSSGAATAAGLGAGQNGVFYLVDANNNRLATFNKVACNPANIVAAQAEQLEMLDDIVAAINAD